MPWSQVPWKAMVVALVFATGVFAIACASANEPAPLKLVPEGATLIAEIELADILEKVDLDSLLDALPDEGDVPQTIDEALDLIVSETGVDLRIISRAIVFGDLEREDDYIGLIVTGVFDEESLVAAIQRAADVTFFIETCKGHDLYIDEDDPDDAALMLLDQETLLFGMPDAVRDVIDVQEGDRDRAQGTIVDALNDLPGGLIRLALAVPPEALADASSGIEALLSQQDLIGDLPVSLEPFEQLEIVGFVLGQDVDALKFHVRLDFADEESASTVADLLDGLLKVAGALAPKGQDLEFLDRIQVDGEGSELTMSLELPISEIRDLLEGAFSISQAESFRNQTPSPVQAAERATVQTAIDSLMADNSLIQVTAPATAVNDFSNLDLDPGEGEVYLTLYLRETATIFYYCWTGDGRVFSQTDSPSPCPQRVEPAIRLLMPDEVAIMPTRNHVSEGQTVIYSTTPPTSGDHWGRWADCGFYPNGLPDELIVHNLEHGNIVVSYNLSEEQEIAGLRRALADIELAEEWGVTRSYDKITEGMVSVAAWGRRARMPGFDLSTLAGFFAAYAGAVGPERITC